MTRMVPRKKLRKANPYYRWLVWWLQQKRRERNSAIWYSNIDELIVYLDGTKYVGDDTVKLQSLIGESNGPVLKSQSFLFDGTAYLTHADILATDTVENDGTSTLSISAGQIDGTAGTAYNIVVKKSGGETRLTIPGTGAGDYVPCDNEGTGDYLTASGHTPATFYHEHADGYGFNPNEVGYTVAGDGTHFADSQLTIPFPEGMIIPADPRDTTKCIAYSIEV